mmetsp:Transcript_13488/g.43019  ORF Transcript_13488/g.43019 Transcript_13488/m.43019 type:complete len:253 (+) Transcript_13488:480-1238(+)
MAVSFGSWSSCLVMWFSCWLARCMLSRRLAASRSRLSELKTCLSSLKLPWRCSSSTSRSSARFKAAVLSRSPACAASIAPPLAPVAVEIIEPCLLAPKPMSSSSASASETRKPASVASLTRCRRRASWRVLFTAAITLTLALSKSCDSRWIVRIQSLIVSKQEMAMPNSPSSTAICMSGRRSSTEIEVCSSFFRIVSDAPRSSRLATALETIPGDTTSSSLNASNDFRKHCAILVWSCSSRSGLTRPLSLAE